jgi:hypothetical protein
VALHLFMKRLHVTPDPICNRSRNVILVGEIQIGLDQCTRLQQSPRPSSIQVRQATFRLSNGKPPLHLRLRRNQIGQALGFSEIHPAVFEGPARELPRLRKANTRQTGQFRKNCRHNRPSPMDLQFSAVLTGKRLGRLKMENDTLIQKLSVSIPNRSEMSSSRSWDPTAHRFENESNLRS